MRRITLFAFVVAVLMSLVAVGAVAQAKPKPTPTPTAAATQTPAPTPSLSVLFVYDTGLQALPGANGNGFTLVTVYCPSNYNSTGGGYSLNNATLPAGAYVAESFPSGGTTYPNGWNIDVYNPSTNTAAVDFWAYADCERLVTP